MLPDPRRVDLRDEVALTSNRRLRFERLAWVEPGVTGEYGARISEDVVDARGDTGIGAEGEVITADMTTDRRSCIDRFLLSVG